MEKSNNKSLVEESKKLDPVLVERNIRLAVFAYLEQMLDEMNNDTAYVELILKRMSTELSDVVGEAKEGEKVTDETFRELYEKEKKKKY